MRKSYSITILHLNQNSITFLGILGIGVIRQTKEKNVVSFAPTFESLTPSLYRQYTNIVHLVTFYHTVGNSIAIVRTVGGWGGGILSS